MPPLNRCEQHVFDRTGRIDGLDRHLLEAKSEGRLMTMTAVENHSCCRDLEWHLNAALRDVSLKRFRLSLTHRRHECSVLVAAQTVRRPGLFVAVVMR
ncbi:MAG TPA: hypothetical protein VKT78_11325 [Fimbriimonadaceae bacterium]|nr:hypothetical protein [Fimbriimonadaceae bacterium]